MNALHNLRLTIGLAVLALGCDGAPTAPTPNPQPPAGEQTDAGQPTSTNPTEEPAMANTDTQQLLTAYINSSKTGERKAGRLALEGGKLTVVSAENDKDQAYLQDAVDDLNATERLVDLAPPKEGAPRYSVGAKEYDREHPEFNEVLLRKLEENHFVRTEPAE